MAEIFNLSSFEKAAPVIKITLPQKEIDVCVFFNMNCCQQFIEDSEENGDYRASFAKSTYLMYADTCAPLNLDCSQEDFLTLSDTELQKVVDCILSQDERVKAAYDEMTCEDPYERFYHANLNVLKSATAGISKGLEQVNKSLQGLKDTYGKIYTVSMSSGIQATQARINAIVPPKIKIPETLSLFADITQRFHFDAIEMIDNIRLAFTIMQDSIANLFASIDFSKIAEYDQWTKQRKALATFGWLYSSELPEVILDEIYDRKDSISQEEVDAVIIGYFRKNRCQVLKQMIKRWNQSPYFKPRATVFHEALVNHSLRYYNASTTLLTVHTEGVISDFVRLNFEPRYRVRVAIEDIKNHVEENTELSLYEYSIYDDILDSINQAFVEEFDYRNPDNASNKSRAKIAHGHVTEKENETNSLKIMLYLNELFYLFQRLDEQIKATGGK